MASNFRNSFEGMTELFRRLSLLWQQPINGIYMTKHTTTELYAEGLRERYRTDILRLLKPKEGTSIPYINEGKRPFVEPRSTVKANTAGELNFQVTKVCVKYLQDRELSYDALNEVIGVLECAKLEFYRKVAAKYEDEKCKANGEVY